MIRRHLKEGPGSGYDVTLSGLYVVEGSVKILKVNEDDVEYEADIKAGGVEVEAEGYDWSVNETCKVLGGKVKGSSELSVDSYNPDTGMKTEHLDEESVKEYIEKDLSGFSVKAMYGGGWSHVSLGKHFELKGWQDSDIQEGEPNGWTSVVSVEIDSDEITDVVDNAWDTKDDDEMFEDVYEESFDSDITD